MLALSVHGLLAVLILLAIASLFSVATRRRQLSVLKHWSISLLAIVAAALAVTLALS